MREATGVDATAATAGLKKAEMVAYCASKLEGTRWLPKPLRGNGTGGVQALGEADTSTGD